MIKGCSECVKWPIFSPICVLCDIAWKPLIFKASNVWMKTKSLNKHRCNQQLRKECLPGVKLKLAGWQIFFRNFHVPTHTHSYMKQTYIHTQKYEDIRSRTSEQINTILLWNMRSYYISGGESISSRGYTRESNKHQPILLSRLQSI